MSNAFDGIVQRISIAVIALAACKDKPPDVAPASSGSAIVATAPVDASVPDAADARCEEACLFLVDMPLARAIDTYKAACGQDWPYAPANCEALLFARNCIYAARGNVFKKPEWKEEFEKRPWYKPRPDFKESELSTVAMTNIKELKRAYEQCDVPEVSAEDKQLIEKLLNDLEIDGVIELDGGASIAKRAAARLMHYHVDERTWMQYARKPTKDRRTIIVGDLMHAVGPGETDEELEVEMTFNAKNELTSIEVR